MSVKNIVIGQDISREKMQRARQLRREVTPAEAVLWAHLRTDQLGAFHFRRQQVIDGFIVDFYCHRCALVVEVDGGIHDVQQASDAQRDAHLAERGFLVLTFPNQDVLGRIHDVKNKILQTCLSRALPLPVSGRGPGG